MRAAASNEVIKVLLVEDNPGDTRLLQEILKEESPDQFNLICVERLSEVAAVLAEGRIDVILLDLSLPDATGLATLTQMRVAARYLPIIILTGSNDEMLALQAVREGAQDYLLKHNLDSLLLKRVLRNAIERKRADQAQRENEERFHALVQNSTDVITILAADMTVLYESPSLEKVMGYRPEAIQGLNITDVIHPDDLPLIMERMDTILDQPAAMFSVEVRLRHADGSWRIQDATITNLLDHPAIQGIVVNSRDITDRRRKENALLESEARFKAITEALPIAVVITDLNSGTILYANDRYCDMTAVPRGAAVGVQARNFFSNSEDRDQFVRDLKETGSVNGRELQFTVADSGVRWLLVSATMITLDGAAAILSGLQDITETKDLEKEQAFLATIVKSTDDAIIGKSLEGVILSWNRGAQAIYGYTSEEAIGQNIQMLSPPERLDEIPTLLGQIRQGGHVTQYETVRLTKTGKRIDISLSIAPIQTRDGVIIGAATTVRDITKRKSAERELVASEQRFRSLFENSPLSLWEQDYSETKRLLDKLHAQGVTDFETCFEQHPQVLEACVGTVRTINVNQATLALYRVPEKSALLQNAPPLIAEMAARTRGFLAAVAAGQTSYQTEFVNKTRDGSLIDIHVTWTVVPGFEDTLEKVICTVVDITERKRAENSLRQYNRRLGVLHSIDRGILTAQSPQRIAQRVAQDLTDMIHCDAIRIIAINAPDNPSPYLADYPPASQTSQDLLRQAIDRYGLPESFHRGELLQIDDVQTHTDFWMGFEEVLTRGNVRSWVIVPLIAGDQLVGILGIASFQPFAFTPEHVEIAREVADQMAIALHKHHLDEQIQEHARRLDARVTERTEQFRAAKERSEAILMSTSDAMMVASLDGSIEQVNTAFTALFGYTLEQGRALSLFSLLDAVSADTVRRTLNQIVEGSPVQRMELVGLRQDGTLFEADAAFSRVEDGYSTTLICSLRDITERKRAEQDLRTALAKERELNELKSRFVSMVAHDFRSP
ncbi:MAG: PAS domain S-box protein, partial [Chloroflexota bacterium]